MKRLSERELRETIRAGMNRGGLYLTRRDVDAARDALAYRRALRKIANMTKHPMSDPPDDLDRLVWRHIGNTATRALSPPAKKRSKK